MERTESKVVQVAPNGENGKIQEQQVFCWNLQGRQEVHEQGDSEGGPDFIGNGYTVKTRVNKYVKLHFVRSLETPHLQEIRKLEAEYDAMERPSYPALIPGGALVIFWLIPWLVLYIPFGYIRKKSAADTKLAALRAKFDEVSQKIELLSA